MLNKISYLPGGGGGGVSPPSSPSPSDETNGMCGLVDHIEMEWSYTFIRKTVSDSIILLFLFFEIFQCQSKSSIFWPFLSPAD